MNVRISRSLFGIVLAILPGCASSRPLPAWVSSVKETPGIVRAVGFGLGTNVPEAFRNARQNATMQIIERAFGESVRYTYKRRTERRGLDRNDSVEDFMRAATTGALFGQRVVHNDVSFEGSSYVAYVMLEVSSADMKRAYDSFVEKERSRKTLVLAETRGAVYLETKHYRKALAYYQGMSLKSPASDVWVVGIGASLYRLGHYRKALRATDKALLLNPFSFYAYWNRSSILDHLGRKEEALQSLEDACRIQPSKPCSRRLASLRRRLGIDP